MFILHSLLPNTMSFIPVKFYNPDCTIFIFDCGNAFQFAPVSTSIQMIQFMANIYSVSFRNYFNLSDFADEFESYMLSVLQRFGYQFGNVFDGDGF